MGQPDNAGGTMRVMRLVVLAVMAGLAGCKTVGSARSDGATDAARSQRHATVTVARDVSVDAFARVEQTMLQDAAVIHATALVPSPIDAEVIERLVRQRMGQVTASAITDLFREGAQDPKVALALRDLMSMLQGLLAPIADQETRSQTLIAALLRNGLTFGVSELARKKVLPALECPAELIHDATYEGLAASTFLKPLGFTQALRQVSAKCQSYTAQVAWFIDTLSTVGLSLQRLVGLQEAVVPVVQGCNPYLGSMPAELRLAIRQLTDASQNPDLKHYRDLKVLIRRHYAELQGFGAAADSCIQGLEGFSSQFESVFEQLGGMSPETGVSLRDLEQSVRRLRLQVLGGLSNEYLQQVFGLDVDLTTLKAIVAVKSDSRDWKAFMSAMNKLGACWSTQTGQQPREATLWALAAFSQACAVAQPGPACVPCQKELDAFGGTYERAVTPLLIALQVEVPSIPPEGFDAEAVRSLVNQVEGAALPLEELPALQSIIGPLVRNHPLRRADVLQVNSWLQARALETWPTGTIHHVLEAAFGAVNQSIREDREAVAGIRMDVPAFTTSMVTRFIDVRRPGLYLRATVGAGYLVRLGDKTADAQVLVPSLYEELGGGYRWQVNPNILVGPHLMTSGLLYQAVSAEETEDSFLLAVGVSANLYRLIDVSLNAGHRWNVGGGTRPDVWVISASLQIPLSDYLTALATDDAEVMDTATSVR